MDCVERFNNGISFIYSALCRDFQNILEYHYNYNYDKLSNGYVGNLPLKTWKLWKYNQLSYIHHIWYHKFFLTIQMVGVLTSKYSTHDTSTSFIELKRFSNFFLNVLHKSLNRIHLDLKLVLFGMWVLTELLRQNHTWKIAKFFKMFYTLFAISQWSGFI